MPSCGIPTPVGRPAVVLLASLCAGACSARTGAPVEQITEPSLRQALLLSSAPAPADRSCHIVREELPLADQLVDSVAVTAELRGLDSSSVLLSLKFDTLGVPQFVRIVEADGEHDERLAAVVERGLRRQAAADSWRLRLVSGPHPAIQIGYSEACPPELMNPEVVGEAVSRAGVREPDRTVVMFRVGEGGRVHETRIVQRPHEFAARQAILGLGDHLLFRPALLDGFPVPVWVRIPIHTITEGGPGWSRGND